jgi:hypothetical protein
VSGSNLAGILDILAKEFLALISLSRPARKADLTAIYEPIF